jgi:hypothetical protein
MGIPNSSTLMNAHVTLMSMGLQALEEVRVPGYELSIAPIPAQPKPEKGKRPKAQEITINVLRNGQPVTDDKVLDEVVAQVTKIIARRHESERNAVVQDRLVIRMVPEPEAKPVKVYPGAAKKAAVKVEAVKDKEPEEQGKGEESKGDEQGAPK